MTESMAAASPAEVRRIKIRAAQVSIYSNTALTLLKLCVGIATGSVSVLSEAAHSANDLIASGIALVSVRVSDKPADGRHPYGHGKVESLSGLAEALLIFGAAAFIVYEAVSKLVGGPYHLDAGPGVLVMGVSALVNTAVSRLLFRVARKTDSLALEADAEHLRTDVYTSVGVCAGLLLVYVTGWNVLDPVAAIAVALLICRAAFRLSRHALEPLLDAHLPPAEMALVRDVLSSDPRVLGFHKLRTRKSGAYRHIDAHVLLDDNLLLVEAHELTEQLEDRIRDALPRTEVILHTEPFHAEELHQYEEHDGPVPRQ